MHTVVKTDEGVLELNWSWLPTWIGQNGMLKKEIEEQLKTKIVGLTMSEDDLRKIDIIITDFIVERHPAIAGLRDYLDGLKFVHFTA